VQRNGVRREKNREPKNFLFSHHSIPHSTRIISRLGTIFKSEKAQIKNAFNRSNAFGLPRAMPAARH
jgi:hypothetical protein